MRYRYDMSRPLLSPEVEPEKYATALAGSNSATVVTHGRAHCDDAYGTLMAQGWALGSFIFLTPVESRGGAFIVYPGSYLRYREADCDALATAKAIAEVNLAFSRELLANVLDLRENHVATRQDVIVAERDVELSRKRLEDATRRVAACREELEKLRRASSD